MAERGAERYAIAFRPIVLIARPNVCDGSASRLHGWRSQGEQS
jgi:hypothetical protein